MMEDNTRLFLGQLLETPGDFSNHIGLSVRRIHFINITVDHLGSLQGRLIMSLTYGYDLKGIDDRMIAAPVQATEMLGQLILPGAVLVNHLPFCEDNCSISDFGLTNVHSAAHPRVGAMV
jgi:hypothetical protein